MTSPTEADAPVHAHRDADSAWGMKIAAGVVAFLLVVEFVLPGFVAAEFSKSGTGFSAFNNFDWSDWSTFPTPAPPPLLRAELDILAAPTWLMDHSEPLRRFYMWEFRLAGGYNLYFFP